MFRVSNFSVSWRFSLELERVYLSISGIDTAGEVFDGPIESLDVGDSLTVSNTTPALRVEFRRGFLIFPPRLVCRVIDDSGKIVGSHTLTMRQSSSSILVLEVNS